MIPENDQIEGEIAGNRGNAGRHYICTRDRPHVDISDACVFAPYSFHAATYIKG